MSSDSTSSGVASSGMLTVLEMAPLMKGWMAAIIFTCPRWWMTLSPIEQANTAMCSGRMWGAPSSDLCSSM